MPSQQDALPAGEDLRKLEKLGKDVGELIRSIDVDQSHLTVLDCLVRKMLADVNVLSSPQPADHMVPPLDAGGVVLIHWSVGLF